MKADQPDPAALHAAARWYVQLSADDVADADHAGWQRWVQADPRHAMAWAQMERLQCKLRTLADPLATMALQRAPQSVPAQRRRALKLLLGGVGIGVAALAGQRLLPWQAGLADYRTATGERRTLHLADGSTLILASASAADVRFDAGLRQVRLHAGEILVQTAPDAGGRPFVVDTPQGRVLALGTRFTVRRDGDWSEVLLLADAVRVEPAAAP
ncbi:FecR domain-containing protein, partial [Chitiniphilus eburneus]